MVECKFYRKCEVAKIFGVSESTVVRWVKEEILPKPIRLALNRIAWDREEIEYAIKDMREKKRGFRPRYEPKQR
jgi:predicted DNA-binding transcriptional regulator AlpA